MTRHPGTSHTARSSSTSSARAHKHPRTVVGVVVQSKGGGGATVLWRRRGRRAGMCLPRPVRRRSVGAPARPLRSCRAAPRSRRPHRTIGNDLQRIRARRELHLSASLRYFNEIDFTNQSRLSARVGDSRTANALIIIPCIQALHAQMSKPLRRNERLAHPLKRKVCVQHFLNTSATLPWHFRDRDRGRAVVAVSRATCAYGIFWFHPSFSLCGFANHVFVWFLPTFSLSGAAAPPPNSVLSGFSTFSARRVTPTSCSINLSACGSTPILQ